jgi:hypothetical protein
MTAKMAFEMLTSIEFLLTVVTFLHLATMLKYRALIGLAARRLEKSVNPAKRPNM